MRTLWLFRIAYVTTLLVSTCPSVEAQQSPEMDTGIAKAGPNSDAADYRYLSLAALQKDGAYDFEYNLCNLRERNMAFYWEDVGFGMDPSDPLPAGLCATFERSGSGRKLEPKTTLIFSGGPQSPPAYLPCEGSGCSFRVSGLRYMMASLRAFITKHVELPLQPNRPTSVVVPLRVVVRAFHQSSGAKEVQVEWAGSGVKFVTFFPDSKLGRDELKQLINPKIGGRFDFDTFPAFKDHSDLLLAGGSKAAIIVTPGDTVASGNFIFQMSQKFPPTRKVIFLVVDQSGRPVARIDAPLP